jgi:hypothetical protein
MTIKKNLTSIVLAGALALGVAGCDKTEIKKVGDLTGDGIQDILMYEGDLLGSRRGNYLFVGQKDGSYVPAKEVIDGDIKYFKTDDGVAYFFDGEFYKPSPKQE